MENTIIISDTHFPYEHPCTFKFLEAVKSEYEIVIAKHSGDVCDNHSASYHEIEYGTLSGEKEFKQARRKVQRLAEIFPKLTTVLGNHCKLTVRKARTAGIPEDHLKTYNDIYGVGWNWTDRDYFKIDKYSNCLLTHSQSSSTLNNAKSHAHCTIQGHHHGVFGIEYFADSEILRWGMTVGCLVNPESPAFNYARSGTLKRPIIGLGCIIQDRPILVPMQLTKTGKWNGRL